jgi:hypothetical protein
MSLQLPDARVVCPAREIAGKEIGFAKKPSALPLLAGESKNIFYGSLRQFTAIPS